MNNINPRDHQKDIFQTKKEGEHHDHDPNNYTNKFSKIINTSTSRQWSTFKNPRIVRVSRTFGGKDRHSKVCTVRGLRDRRIRLSVPTAIQLYDLQDRLGLSQPSKVVDWLLEATKHEIDKLPPLPIIPGLNFPMNEPNIQENQGFEGFLSGNHQISAQNLFPLSSSNCQSSSIGPNFPSNLQWDPPNLSLSHFGPSGGYYSFSNDQDESHRNLSLNPQLYLPSIVAPFSSQMINTSIENNIDHLRQINHFQNLQQNSIFPATLHLISSPMKSFGFDVNSKSVNSQENGTGRRGKDQQNI